jgi:hypothetical protein
MNNWRTIQDANGETVLQRKIVATIPVAMTGWETVARRSRRFIVRFVFRWPRSGRVTGRTSALRGRRLASRECSGLLDNTGQRSSKSLICNV